MSAPPYPGPPTGVYEPEPTIQSDIMEKGPPPPEMSAPPHPGPPTGVYELEPTSQSDIMEKGPPPPKMSAPPHPGPPTGVYQAQPTVQSANNVAVMHHIATECPAQMWCPHCQTSVLTRTEFKIGMCTWLICFFLGLFMCWPCCFIPFCVKSCKDVEHICPSCNNVLYIYNRR
ncbi:Lipopolysaccharide-induced tumor necrosis factor-alpha factor -like protein [Collichthys lucidus]|uniref:Lipopolysaccharide-induced tumor necrosis factor-alpha factor-like protein n=1 Tax=Collichthys lucidus TaxID=240159 RepID=A0A4U5U4S3_COLLU|nr:Lipopolysaccharide-induced tumor necrosis factor-alpha factor -like protein [Collichthys lucidus]